MFATIETNGATHILINIPHEGASKSLPALASMLENNAVFVKRGYSEASIVKPGMMISLGDHLLLDFTSYSGGVEMVIKAEDSTAVLDDSFMPATVDAFVSCAKSSKAKDDEINRLRTELSFVKSENERMKSQLEALIAAEADQ
jgi:hypothetical protein